MVLNDEQVRKLIINPKNKAMLDEAKKYHKQLIAHVYNIGLDERLGLIDTYENKTQLTLRQRYKRTNKHIYSQMMRPLDKVYSSRGGAKYYNLTPDKEKQFKNILSNISDNISIQKWFETKWKDKRICDPNGLIFQEISEDGLSTYPTYKEVTIIHDIEKNGYKVEYVIFDLGIVKIGEDDYKKFRIVDDIRDIIAYLQLDKVSESDVNISKDEMLPNYFGKVPALVCSMQKHAYYDYQVSFFDSSIELADELLMDSSVRNIYKKRSGFPYIWQYEKKCKVCKGEGEIEARKCTACGGTGIDSHIPDVTDIINVMIDAEGKANPVPPLGHISPPTEVWNQMNIDINDLRKLMSATEWGIDIFAEDFSDTATGKVMNTQIRDERVSVFAEEAEEYEKFFTDLTGFFYFGDAYKGSTIIYGKRYIFKTYDQQLEEIIKSKQANVPEIIIHNQIIEYLQAKYDNDSFEMAKQIKIFKLDPYAIWSIKEMKDFGFSSEDINKKILFIEWINSLDNNILLFSNENKLKTLRDDYISINLKKEENADLQRSSET